MNISLPIIFSYSYSEKPEDYNLPADYTYVEKLWGNLFYKIYQARNYGAAKAQCEFDGAKLAIPRSEAENDFIADLIPNEKIWIGINDIDQEGLFVAVDGSHISWTKWAQGQPDNSEKWGDDGQDGVVILQGTDLQNIPKSWDDQVVSDSRRFVCLRYITRIL